MTAVQASVQLNAHGRSVSMAFDDPNDHIAKKVLSGRFYEEYLLDDARRRMRQGLVVDVGAHVGNHAVFFAGICGARVVAFEPNPASYAQLLANVKRNAVDVQAYLYAVGSEAGYGSLEELRPGNSGMTRVVPDPDGDVRIVTLDEMVLFDVAVLKIDAEDSELEVLKGARQLLKREKPLLYFEARTDKQRVHIEDFLEPLGYRMKSGPFNATPTWCYG